MLIQLMEGMEEIPGTAWRRMAARSSPRRKHTSPRRSAKPCSMPILAGSRPAIVCAGIVWHGVDYCGQIYAKYGNYIQIEILIKYVVSGMLRAEIALICQRRLVMKIVRDMSDSAVLNELGSRIARSRLNRNLTQAAFAREAGISQRTLIRIEHGESTQTTNIIRILRVLHILENVEALIPEPAISPIQQLQLHGKSRKRASPESAKPRPKKSWSWGNSEGDNE